MIVCKQRANYLFGDVTITCFESTKVSSPLIMTEVDSLFDLTEQQKMKVEAQ